MPAPPITEKNRAWLALLLIAPAPSIGAWISFHASPGTTLGDLAYGVGKAWLYVFPVAWLWLVERGRVSWSPARRGGFTMGIGLGVVIALVIWLTFLFVVEPGLDVAQLRDVLVKVGLGEPWKYAVACAWLALVNAMLEEYAFRWFINGHCERAIRGWRWAILFGAIVFTVHHVIVLRAYFDWPVTLLAASGVFAGGVAWSICYRRYGSIWPGYVSHIIADLAIFAIGWRLLFGAA